MGFKFRVQPANENLCMIFLWAGSGSVQCYAVSWDQTEMISCRLLQVSCQGYLHALVFNSNKNLGHRAEPSVQGRMLRSLRTAFR